MPDVRTKLGRYCAIHKYIHEDEYLVCDFCNEHKWSVYYHDRYYNYGFSKCVYCACNECHDTLFGPFRLGLVDDMMKAYETIMQVIKNKSEDKDEVGNRATVDYYEAARIAYKNGFYMRKYIDADKEIKDIDREINKWFRPMWELTYRIVSREEKQRIKVVNKDPDNLLVQWVPGGKTITDILKEMSVRPLS